jgi:hypothetical protein
MRRRRRQAKTSGSNLSENRPGHCSAHRQGGPGNRESPEDSRTGPNTVEASNRSRRTDYLKSGTTGHVNPFVDTEIISSYLSNRLPAIKSPLLFSQRGQEHFPLSLSELLELSAHPLCNTPHLQYKETLDIGLLPHRIGLNQDKL